MHSSTLSFSYDSRVSQGDVRPTSTTNSDPHSSVLRTPSVLSPPGTAVRYFQVSDEELSRADDITNTTYRALHNHKPHKRYSLLDFGQLDAARKSTIPPELGFIDLENMRTGLVEDHFAHLSNNSLYTVRPGRVFRISGRC